VNRRKIKINTKAKREIDKYPLVEVHWYDIVSDSNWQSISGCIKAKLPPCITKGHLLSQKKGLTRIFGDYILADGGLDSFRPIVQVQEVWAGPSVVGYDSVFP